jgi:hypothetical protein
MLKLVCNMSYFIGLDGISYASLIIKLKVSN